MTYDHLRVYDGQHWQIYLHENQCYLGRTYLWAKRSDDVDLLEMTVEERDEFFRLGTVLKSALSTVFKPDRINYAALSNTSHHLHVHVVPRYTTPRMFLRQEFVDKNPTGNYAPYDKNFSVDPHVLHGIQVTLTDALTRALHKVS